MSGSVPVARRAMRRMRPHRPQRRCGRSAQRAQTGRWWGVAGGDRLDDPAAGAGGGELTTPAAGTYPTHIGAGQRPIGAPATHAARHRQHRAQRAQLPEQPADHRRRAHRQGVRVGVQGSGEAAQHRRVGRHGIDRRGHLGSGQRRVGSADRLDDRLPVALPTGSVGPGQSVPGPAVQGGTHPEFPPLSGATRARVGRGGGSSGPTRRAGRAPWAR